MKIPKKIKLVTFAPHPNFGTCLQSYALNTVLKKMGHQVQFIYNERETPPITIKYYIKQCIKILLPKHFVGKYKIVKKINSQKDSVLENESPYIIKLPNHYLLKFLNKIHLYSHIYKKYKCKNLQWKKVYKFTFEDGNYDMKRLFVAKDYRDVTHDADMFITGSDRIWNPYCGGFNPMMFLEFAGDKKRIAYSSSISRPSFPIEVEERAKKDLQLFQHIAVREQSSVDLLNKLLGRNDVKLVVDPTYLLSKDDWIEFGNRATIEFKLPERYILCYFVGDDRTIEYNEMVENVKKKMNIEDVITVECYNRYVNYGGGRLYKDAGPYEFVYLLSHAKIVCMDSFHATVFALKFNIDFVHILKTKDENTSKSQNSRIYDILRRYGLLYKLYNKNNDKWLSQIDFSKINAIMNNEIKDSLNYLKYEINN